MFAAKPPSGSIGSALERASRRGLDARCERVLWAGWVVALVSALASAGCGRLHFDSDPAALDAFRDAGRRRDAGALPDAQVVDAGRDAGHVDGGRADGGSGGTCGGGTRSVSGGRCGTVLFHDDFEDGVIDPAWRLMRMQFEERAGKLRSLPAARPGFSYGHEANGRDALAALHLGDRAWTNYRFEVTFDALGVDAAFNPYGLPVSCYRAPAFYVRLQEYAESWNDPSHTSYTFGMTQSNCGSAVGDWGLGRMHGFSIPGTGWSSTHVGAQYSLASGSFPSIPATGENRFIFEVEGSRVRGWVNGAVIFDYDDTSVGYAEGGAPLTWGGVMIDSAFEQMWTADDVFVTAIP